MNRGGEPETQAQSDGFFYRYSAASDEAGTHLAYITKINIGRFEKARNTT